LEDAVNRPKVAVAALVISGEYILLAERHAGKLQGQYAAPGGHLEWMEKFEDAAIRELHEETGMTAKPEDCEVVGVGQGFAPEEDHCWVVVFVRIRAWAGKPEVMEPEKQGLWGWYPLDALPANVLEPLRQISLKLVGRAR